MIPFIDLVKQGKRVKSKIIDSVSEIIDSAAFIGGKYVDRCEEELSVWSGRSALCVSSGTDALYLALLALDLKPDQVVFVPSFTFAASAEVIALIGAIPYFVDVNPDDFNMCPRSLKDAIYQARQSGYDAAGVIVVDLFGQPADHESIGQIAEEHGLWVIDDAAQAFGSNYQGKSVTTQGVISTTSFFPAKPLGCYGDGGALFVDEGPLLDKLISLRVHGQGKNRYTYQHVGINGRLDNIQAAVLVHKLELFADEIEARVNIASRYTQHLKECVKTPIVHSDRSCVYAQYTIQVPMLERDNMMASLREKGVPSVVYYPTPIHQQPAYLSYPATPMPNTQRLCQTVMSLPMHPYLEENDQEQIIEAVLEASHTYTEVAS